MANGKTHWPLATSHVPTRPHRLALADTRSGQIDKRCSTPIIANEKIHHYRGPIV